MSQTKNANRSKPPPIRKYSGRRFFIRFFVLGLHQPTLLSPFQLAVPGIWLTCRHDVGASGL